MQDTESYLLHVKNDFLRRASVVFLYCLAVTVLAFACAYGASYLFGADATYQFMDPISKGNVSLAIKTALTSQIPLAVQLALLLVSVFTLANRWITFALCAWRGVCLGVAVQLMTSGRVWGLGGLWTLSLAVYFAATLLFMALAAMSSVYSRALVHTFASDATRYSSSLAVEFVKYFLIISGGIFLFGCVTAILI